MSCVKIHCIDAYFYFLSNRTQRNSAYTLWTSLERRALVITISKSTHIDQTPHWEVSWCFSLYLCVSFKVWRSLRQTPTWVCGRRLSAAPTCVTRNRATTSRASSPLTPSTFKFSRSESRTMFSVQVGYSLMSLKTDSADQTVSYLERRGSGWWRQEVVTRWTLLCQKQINELFVCTCTRAECHVEIGSNSVLVKGKIIWSCNVFNAVNFPKENKKHFRSQV